MSVLRRLTLLTLPLLVAACNAEDAKITTEATTPVKAEVSEVAPLTMAIDHDKITERFRLLGLEVLEISPSDMLGIAEVKTSGGVLFSSLDGEFFLAGTLYQLSDDGQYVDVLAQRQAPVNAEKIAALSDSVIEFKADNEKYVVTVFTDITCGYCVRLHNQLSGYNDLGITVRYMAYPRQGPQGDIADKMATIWCADDPKSAMHDGKVNRVFPAKNKNFAQCQETIKQHYILGRELGISGTPSIFLPSGEMLGGYLPPAELIKRLQAQ